jgi:hypothetical protein
VAQGIGFKPQYQNNNNNSNNNNNNNNANNSGSHLLEAYYVPDTNWRSLKV